jgi:hypothetical protein
MLTACLLFLAIADDSKSPDEVIAGLKAGLRKDKDNRTWTIAFGRRRNYAGDSIAAATSREA